MFVGQSRAQTVPEGSKDILGQPSQDDLEVYEALTKLPFPKSYAGKMLLVAFRGLRRRNPPGLMEYRIAPEDGRGGRGFLAISFLADPPSSTFFLRTDDDSRMKNPA
jgi:hypothetical protein